MICHCCGKEIQEHQPEGVFGIVRVSTDDIFNARWFEAVLDDNGDLWGRFLHKTDKNKKRVLMWCKQRKATEQDCKVIAIAPATWEQQYMRKLILLNEEGYIIAA